MRFFKRHFLAGAAAILILFATTFSAMSVVTAAPPNGNTRLERHRGFDYCGTASTSTMSSWYSPSPFGSVGFYIGGITIASVCPATVANHTNSWVSTVTAQGWNTVPIWDGLQSPCSGNSHRFAYGGGYSAGFTEGANAITIASGLGFLSGAVLWIDLEGDNGTCHTDTNAFIQGWTNVLKAYGYKAGVYTSTYNGNSLATNSPPPDEVWFAKWDNAPSVFALGGIVNPVYWTLHQRAKQYVTQHNETYNGITLQIDTDCLDTYVSGVTTHSLYSACL